MCELTVSWGNVWIFGYLGGDPSQIKVIEDDGGRQFSRARRGKKIEGSCPSVVL